MNPIEIAKKAAPTWATLSVQERIEYIKKLRVHMVNELDSLVEYLHTILLKPPVEAITGDILAVLEFLRYYENQAEKILRRRRLKKNFFFFGSSFYQEYSPLGVVLVISPWNYPFQLALVPTISALLAGNTVVLKPSEFAPGIGALLQKLFHGFPDGIVQVVEGAGDVGQSLIEQGPDKIFFTGSLETGKKIMRQAADKLIPISLELGGKDAMLVFDDADLTRAVRGAIYGAFVNAGQVCLSVERLYVQQGIYPKFLELLKSEVHKLKIGNLENSDMGGMIRPAQIDLIFDQVKEAQSLGAKLETPLQLHGRYLHPIILSSVPENCALMAEESFGPVLPIATFATEQEAIGLANNSIYGLGASIWTKDFTKARRVASAIEVGSVSVNDVIRGIANPYVAFGGEKKSGMGRYHGEAGLFAFSRQKVIQMNRAWFKKELNWFPYSAKLYQTVYSFIKALYGQRGIIMNTIAKILPLFLIAFAPGISWSEEIASVPNLGKLLVHVNKIPSNKGQIGYTIFDNPNGFPGKSELAVKRAFVAILGNDETNFEIPDLKFGEYAVAIYHDENSNQKMDTNFFGIPTEAAGASNNPPPRMGPPRYEESKFEFKTPNQELVINLVK